MAPSLVLFHLPLPACLERGQMFLKSAKVVSLMTNSLPSHGSGMKGRNPTITTWNFLPLVSPGQAGRGRLFWRPSWSVPGPTGPGPSDAWSSSRPMWTLQMFLSNDSDLCRRRAVGSSLWPVSLPAPALDAGNCTGPRECQPSEAAGQERLRAEFSLLSVLP